MKNDDPGQLPQTIPVRPGQVEAVKIAQLEEEIERLRAENAALKDKLIALLESRHAPAMTPELIRNFPKYWTPSELRQAVALRVSGKTHREIAVQMGRTYSSTERAINRAKAMPEFKAAFDRSQSHE